MKLVLIGEQFTGSVQHPRAIDFSDNGEVKSFSEEQSDESLQEAKLTGDGLLLTVKDDATHEVDRFAMQLTSDTTAYFKMLAMSMPPGMPKPKPWKLVKAGGAPVAPGTAQ